MLCGSLCMPDTFDELHAKCEKLLAELKVSPDAAKRRLLLREFRKLLEDADVRDQSMRTEELERARRLKDSS